MCSTALVQAEQQQGQAPTNNAAAHEARCKSANGASEEGWCTVRQPPTERCGHFSSFRLKGSSSVRRCCDQLSLHATAVVSC
eukprot:14922032-Alexandrium_andersonii.AAC.1